MNISKSFLSQQGDKNKNYLKNKEKTQTKKNNANRLSMSVTLRRHLENLRLITLFCKEKNVKIIIRNH